MRLPQLSKVRVSLCYKKMSEFRLVAIFLALIVAKGDTLRCFSCDSYTYLDTGFTNIDSEEDMDCVAGTQTTTNQAECRVDATCTVTEGIVTWFVKGYGFVDAKMTLRSCIQLIGGSFPEDGCFNSHDSYHLLYQLIGEKYVDRELTNFNGTFCGCTHIDSCNDNPGSAPVITKGNIPKANPRGVQCLTCYHQEYHDPTYQALDKRNPSCSEADIESDSVYYYTCATGGVCGVIDGELTYLGATSNYFGRGCFYGIAEYPTTERTDGLLCVSSQNASQIVTPYLLAQPPTDTTNFAGELCYCTTDFCELPYKVYKDDLTGNHSYVNGIHTGVLILSYVLYGILVFIR